MVLGTVIGIYFVITYGIIIGAILGFAVVSIYFYSTKIVDWGLAEVFVAIKGTMIVIGTYFVQTSQISESVILGGIVVGVLSSLVLFITSFPDHDADKSKGRKTLVINLGKQKACTFFWIFPIIIYSVTIVAVIISVFPIFCLIILGTIPMVIKSGKKLKHGYNELNKIIPVMSSTLVFSRLTGVLLVFGFIINIG